MRQRLAIAISGLVAAAVLAVGLTAAGFGPEPRPAAAEEVEAVAAETTIEDTEPEVVYIKPAPKPQTVVVKKRVQQKAASSAKKSTKRTRATRSGDDDDEAEERRERRRESVKERREERREEAKERRERKDEDEDDD